MMKPARWNKPHPCPPTDEAKWYWAYSEDSENWSGPFDTREAAIADGRGNNDPEDAFFIQRWHQRHVDLARKFDAGSLIDSYLDDDWEDDGADENGDGHPLEEMTDDLIEDLEESIRLAIWHFQERKGLKLKSWWMEAAGGFDRIEGTPKEDGQ